MEFFTARTFWVGCVVVSGLLMTGCSGQTNLEWHQKEGYQWAELSTGYFGDTGFDKLESSSTNIKFQNSVTEQRIRENRNYLNGSGVAAADVDGDGLVDLYFAQLDGPNALYKNQGNMQFKDVAAEAGVAHEGYNSTGVVFADVDGDGDPDLLVTSLTEKNHLYINDGTGNFELKQENGLGPSKGSNTMTLADIDGDRDLDLYITNYNLKTARDIYSASELQTQKTIRKQGDSVVVIPPFDQYYGIIDAEDRSYRNEYGASDELYINDGKGNFEKVNEPENRFLDPNGQPMGLPRDWGLTAHFQDLNDDRRPDLFVANDFWTPDRLWINQGGGIFKLASKQTLPNMSLSSMGVDFSDINRDGALDFFVTEMLSGHHQRRMRQLSEKMDLVGEVPQYNRNSLYLNRGDDTFAEISYFAGLQATEWSWATNFLDIDLDGYEDLIITTGHAYDYQDMDTQMQLNRRSSQAMGATDDVTRFPKLELQNKMYRNNGDLSFSDQSSAWGFAEEDLSNGMAYADLDNDGDPDLAINRLNQEATVYENKTHAPRIAVQLEGNSPNTAGIGANITLHGAEVVQQKQLVVGGTYVSGPQPAVFFAADEGNTNHQLEVTWPDGTQTRIDSVQANRMYVINQRSAESRDKSEKTDTINAESPIFSDESNRISHSHSEDPYTDTNIQPMLPMKVSEQGPGISWIDIDRDGDDDLLIAAGKGYTPGVFINDGDENFVKSEYSQLSTEAPGDQTTLLGWAVKSGTNLLVGNANFEQGDPKVPSAHYYLLDDNVFAESSNIPGILSTTGPLAAADYDADGDIDLFVGGSFNPAKYPQDASSRLFLNEDGSYQPDRTNSQTLSQVGLVAGAVFTDYDGDGDPDLLLARQWDSLLLLQNDDGNFRNVSTQAGLHEFKGWWNGVSTGDFNNDGRLDIVATNIGQNSVYQLDSNQPLKLFYSDFNMDRRLDIVDAYYNEELQGYVPRRRLYSFDSLPGVLRGIKSHSEFASSTVDEIFRQDFNKVPSKEINTIQHMLFINNGQGFDAKPLPYYPQLTAAFQPAVLDFDNDGHEDLFLSQNHFDTPSTIPRIDAGRGLLLRGHGTGAFTPIKGQESGIKIYGEQRGAATADFNRDGRTDLAVAQNQDSTKLFLNQTEKTGLRVTLQGPSQNRDAIGSAVRLIYENGSKGPIREIQAGSGYWSQHSTTQVLGYSGDPVALEVHWFDGSSQTVELAGQDELVVEYQ